MSTSYNSLERSIAKILARFPIVKVTAKRIYSKLVYLKFKKNYCVKSNFDIVEVGDFVAGESFFGYFDKSPVSVNGLTLVHHTDQKTNKLPDKNYKIKIFVYDGCNQKFFDVVTSSYNWQQGSRAHWLDKDKFIFNDFDEEEGVYVSRIYSVEKKAQIKKFEHPVQDSFRCDYFLSINYRRLMAMRPDYGYRNLPVLDTVELANTCNDGIWKISFNTGDSELLYSIDDIKLVDQVDEFEYAVHKVNHVSISPCGDKFIFLHRYFLGSRRFDRLMLANSDGSGIRVLSSNGMVSHCFWADENTILGYLRGPNGKDAYWLIDIQTGDFTHFANGELDKYGDGHPHVVGDWFITDTYPDKSRMQHLLLCNWKTGEFKEIGEFFHGFNYSGETRCDLHPRLSTDGKSIFFDSVYSGKRKLYRIELDQ